MSTPTTPGPVRLAGLCGSLRNGSLNAAVLATAADLCGPSATMSIHPGLDRLPYFSHDIEMDCPPPPVVEFRELLSGADAVLITSPEYAHGTSGMLKNALEWSVGSGDLVGKPVAVVTASPSFTGGDRAQAWVRETLEVMGAVLLPPLMIASAGPQFRDGRVQDEAILNDLRSVIAQLAEAAHEAQSPVESTPALALDKSSDIADRLERPSTRLTVKKQQ